MIVSQRVKVRQIDLNAFYQLTKLTRMALRQFLGEDRDRSMVMHSRQAGSLASKQKITDLCMRLTKIRITFKYLKERAHFFYCRIYLEMCIKVQSRALIRRHWHCYFGSKQNNVRTTAWQVSTVKYSQSNLCATIKLIRLRIYRY
jgi:hypothetical protein